MPRFEDPVETPGRKTPVLCGGKPTRGVEHPSWVQSRQGVLLLWTLWFQTSRVTSLEKEMGGFWVDTVI